MHILSKDALAASAEDEALAVKTFSVNISDDRGGSEATRLFKL